VAAKRFLVDNRRAGKYRQNRTSHFAVDGPPANRPARQVTPMPDWLIAFVIALVIGTLVEYWGHRAMHTFLLRKKYAEHHRDGVGQGWFGEFVDYVVGVLVILPVGFLYSLEAGIGFLAGGLAYAAFAAYSHQ